VKIKVEITHPQWLLISDKVGTDISQKYDGHVGGQKFITAKGTRANIKSSHKDGRFTVIGLTAASGKAVMAIVFLLQMSYHFKKGRGKILELNTIKQKVCVKTQVREEQF